MNVLVYSGPGVSQTSLHHTLNCLRSLLLPHYTVQTITPQSLASDPWSSNCALLVLPGGRDLPYESSLTASNALIKGYVEKGGAFLGICAGAYYASKRVEWEVGTSMEVSGDRPLRFFGGVSRGCVYPGFQYESENGARAVSLDVNSPDGIERLEALYYNGGGEFLDAETIPNVRVLARYVDGEGEGKVAGVSCQVGAGKAVLWAVHPEYPLTQGPASLAMARTRPHLTTVLVEENDHKRWKLMKDTLTILGLTLPSPNVTELSHPLPQFLSSSPSKQHISKVVLDALSDHLSQTAPHTLEDVNDTFCFHTLDEAADLMSRMRSMRDTEPSEVLSQPKHIVICPDGHWPPKANTPLFDIQKYYTDLANQRSMRGLEASTLTNWGMGEALLYGEIVTSTQTMLDKNPKLLPSLPTPLLSLASHQLSGRGRGSNTWLSPSGCLQFSLLLRLSLSSLPASKLVFVQYLFGLAVVEACRNESVLGSFGEQLRLKWPNDIYVVGHDGVKKVGGILVNTSFTGSEVDLVIGCGLNVLNPPPMTSLAHIVPPGLSWPELSMERTAASIMATFDEMWSMFLSARGSFDPFMDLYLERWLHSDQVVTLNTTEPPTVVRIVGITADHGLLRTLPEYSSSWSGPGEPYIDLQPDGNSFDLMAGLIRVKS